MAGGGLRLELGDAGVLVRAGPITTLGGEQTRAFDAACQAAGAQFGGGVMAMRR